MPKVDTLYILKSKDGWVFGYNNESVLPPISRIELWGEIDTSTWELTFLADGRIEQYRSFDEIHADLLEMMLREKAQMYQTTIIKGKRRTVPVDEPREQWAALGERIKELLLTEDEDDSGV